LRVVLGIGNPGVKYVDTRHNAGFIVIDRFVEQHKLKYEPSKSDYHFCLGKVKDNDFIIVRPSTYVNNSGFAALDVLEKHDIEIDQLLVIVDDININTGQIRVRKSGGSGGHNGLESIIYHLQSENFPRIRFGIGNDFEEGYQADYVLSKFTNKEFDELKDNFKFSVELTEKFIEGGNKLMFDHFSKFSNKINQKNPPPEIEEN